MYIYAVCTVRLVSCCIFIVPHVASVTRIEKLKINLKLDEITKEKKVNYLVTSQPLEESKST